MTNIHFTIETTHGGANGRIEIDVYEGRDPGIFLEAQDLSSGLGGVRRAVTILTAAEARAVAAVLLDAASQLQEQAHE